MVTHSALFVHKFTPPPDLQKLSRRVAQLTSARSAGLLPFRHVSRRNRKNTPAGRGRSTLLWPYRPSAAVSNRKWYGNCSLQHTSATSRTDKERNKHAMSSFRCQHFMWHTKRGNNVRAYSLSAPNLNAKLPEVSNRRSRMC